MDVTRIAKPTEYALLGRGTLATGAVQAQTDLQMIASLQSMVPPARSTVPGKGQGIDVTA